MPPWPWDGISQADYGPPVIVSPYQDQQIYGPRASPFHCTSSFSRTSTLGEVPNSSYTLWYIKPSPVLESDSISWVIEGDSFTWPFNASQIESTLYVACRAASIDGHYSKLSASVRIELVFFPAPIITIPSDGQKLYTATVSFTRSSIQSVFDGADSSTHWFWNKGSPPLISGPNTLVAGMSTSKIFVPSDVGTWYVAVRARTDSFVSKFSQVSSFILSPTEAQFSASPKEFLELKSVQFMDETPGNPTSWSWKYRASDSGDSWVEFSTLQNPTKVFSV